MLFLITFPFIRSRVKVELDDRTREESVDIEAENTSIITTAIRKGDKVSSIDGIILSYPPVGMPLGSTPILPE